MKEFFLDLIFAIFRPDYWMMLYPYSKPWDKILNSLMETDYFIPIKDRPAHYAKIGEFEVWTSNHPYSSFTLKIDGIGEIRPSRRTICKARKKLEADIINTHFVTKTLSS